MVAVGILGLLSLVMLQMMRDQSLLSSRSSLDTDLAQAKAQILSYLTSPNHCNSNFYGKPLTGNPTAVYKCSTSQCHGSGAVTAIPVVAGGTSSTDALWSQATTGISSKVRISSISYAVPAVKSDADPQYKGTISILTYTVNFQTRLESSTAKAAEMKSATELGSLKVDFKVPVIVNGSISPQLIIACPTSWNSTVPY